MSGNVSKRRRAKKPAPPPGHHWRGWCPICVEPVEKIVTGLFWRGQGSKRVTYWACEGCAGRYKVFAQQIPPGGIYG